ncbi:MAG: hypothetical protein OEY39_07235 [Candidatus Bathyarchaeota archaeon]|nr:hypothetical protein [Candidatus Bathyarchaeota archaeon]MDH5624243.1 hypothetical protein [Candidatus Bathyarchaeota archaeon]
MKKTKLRLTTEQREKMLRNLWLLHDGRWFLKAIGEFGFDYVGNMHGHELFRKRK